MKPCYRTSISIFAFVMILAFALPEMTAAAVTSGDLTIPPANQTQILTLKDGSKVNGRITEVRDDEVDFETSVGPMTIPVDRIQKIETIASDRIKGGEVWFENPNQTRMYVGPTARMLEKGHGYFTDIYIFFPAAAYAITDNITVGGGMSIFPGLDLDEQLIYFTPKIGLNATEDFSLAVSGLVVFLPDWDDDLVDEPSTVGVVFGVGTYGTADKSVTFGLGYGYAEDDFADKPAVILGGEYRISRRISLVTENWVLPAVDPPLLSYGVRFFGEGIAVDLALLNIADEDAIFPGIPFIDFVWNF